MDDFYDQLTDFYDLIYDDWDASIVKQGDQLSALISKNWAGSQSVRCILRNRNAVSCVKSSWLFS